MASLPTESFTTIPPTLVDAQLAQQSSRSLTQFLTKQPKEALRIRLEPSGEAEQAVTIPFAAVGLLNGILSEMAKGNAVALIPVLSELTTQQAADLLNVSRPFLIEQLEKGAIPFRKVGTHRRVVFQDLMKYKHVMDQNRMEALSELSALDQQLGLGY